MPKDTHLPRYQGITHQKLAYIVIGVMLATLVLDRGLVFLHSTQDGNAYSYLNPQISLVDKKNLLVNFEPLRKDLLGMYANREDYMVSLYFEYLPTGANISVNRDERIWPASLIKIPVAVTAMKKVNDGIWKLSNELVILDDDKDIQFGDLYKQPTGTTLSIERLLEESLIHSDNTAHFVLLRNIDPADLEETYTHLGMGDIIDALKKTPEDRETDNRMTAKQYTIFFRSLYNATYLSPEYSQQFLSILGQAPKEYLNKGMPSEVMFVHKTGVRADNYVWADAGIVYVPGRPYLLTVMIQKKGRLSGEPGEKEQAEVGAIFKDIAQTIYTYVSTAQ